MQAFPGCKLTHKFVKESLEAFGKVNEAMIGTDLVDGLYNQISLSLRVLLSHFRRCARQESVWSRAQRRYKGCESLEPVSAIIQKIVVEEIDDEDEEEEEDTPELMGQNCENPPCAPAPIQFSATPTPEFWKVQHCMSS